jgi:DNA-binding MarR family transcriptional regulator
METLPTIFFALTAMSPNIPPAVVRPPNETPRKLSLRSALNRSYILPVADLDPAEELGDELMRTNAALRRLVRRQIEPPDIPGPRLRGAQIELLRVVEEQPGIGVAPAAKVLRMAANSVSTLVNQLADDGLLLRETDEEDRRAIRLHLTEAAAVRLAAWRRARARFVGAGVAKLPAADRTAIARALPAIRALMARLEGEETT